MQFPSDRVLQFFGASCCFFLHLILSGQGSPYTHQDTSLFKAALLLTISADGRAGDAGGGRDVVGGGLLGDKSHNGAV